MPEQPNQNSQSAPTVRMLSKDGRVFDIPQDWAATAETTYGLVREGATQQRPARKLSLGEQAMGLPKGGLKTSLGPFFDKETYKGLQAAMQTRPQVFGGPEKSNWVDKYFPPQNVVNLMGNLSEGIVRDPKHVAAELVDAPNIKKDFQQGRWGEGTGRVGGQLVMLLLNLLKGGQAVRAGTNIVKEGEVGNLVKGGMTAVNESRAAKGLEATAAIGANASNIGKKGNDVAKVLTSGLREHWDKQMRAIESGPMAGHILDFTPGVIKGTTNVANMRQAMSKAMRVLEMLERAPGTKVGAVVDAKEVIDRLRMDLLKTNGIMEWDKAAQYSREVGEAVSNLKGASSQALGATNDVNKILQEALRAGAKDKGVLAEYDKLIGNYREMSNWERGFAKIVEKSSPAQMEAALVPKHSTIRGAGDIGALLTGLGVSFAGFPQYGVPLAAVGAIDAPRAMRSAKAAATGSKEAAAAKRGLEALYKKFGLPVPTQPVSASTKAAAAVDTAAGVRAATPDAPEEVDPQRRFKE